MTTSPIVETIGNVNGLLNEGLSMGLVAAHANI